MKVYVLTEDEGIVTETIPVIRGVYTCKEKAHLDGMMLEGWHEVIERELQDDNLSTGN